MRLNLLVCVLSLFLLCSGCAFQTAQTTPFAGHPALTELSAEQLFAIHPDGNTLAYVNNGLELLRLSDGYRQRLLFDAPAAILWSTDGRQLVAAVREGEQTRLVQLTTAAETRSQVFVTEQVTDLAWLADGSLLALAQHIEEEETAVHVQVRLLFWDGSRDVERKPLYRFSYVKPVTEYGSFVPRVVHRFDLSPLQDELIYNRYLDSPLPGGRIQQVLYNLQTAREQVLSVTDNRQPEALFSADAEHILLPQTADVILYNPWTRKAESRWPGSGQAVQIADHRNLFLIDGRLFTGRKLLLQLPAEVKGQFSADGSRLFAVYQRMLYLVEGYPLPEKIQYTELKKLRLQRIRQQRSREEISLREYYQLRNNILHP